MARRGGIAQVIKAIKISARGTPTVNRSNGSSPIETHQGLRKGVIQKASASVGAGGSRRLGEPNRRSRQSPIVDLDSPRYAEDDWA
jgi:hypothetical protein